MDEQTLPQQTVSGISGGGDVSLYQYFISSPLFAEFSDFSGGDRKIFMSEYINFSPSLKNFLSSTDTATGITAIGLSYQLDDGQVSRVAGTIRELIQGKVFIKDFPITLSSKLGIDDVKAGEIANKIISQSFGPIIEDLKRIQRSKFPDKISQLQKESVPEKMTQSTARPITPRESLTPAQKITQNMPTPNKPAMSSPPPIQSSPIAPTEAKPQNPVRPPVSSFRPPAPENMSSKPLSQSAIKPDIRPPQQAMPRPEFKIPDLSNIPSGGAKESSKNAPNKNLEDELEKIANVIDLRSQEK